MSRCVIWFLSIVKLIDLQLLFILSNRSHRLPKRKTTLLRNHSRHRNPLMTSSLLKSGIRSRNRMSIASRIGNRERATTPRRPTSTTTRPTSASSSSIPAAVATATGNNEAVLSFSIYNRGFTVHLIPSLNSLVRVIYLPWQILFY